jgi:membrane protein YqaA with SNARE-associated domain
MRVAASRHAQAWLGVLAFAEGVFFPIPPDVMLMPMVLADRSRAWRYAAITVTASVLGGCTGYGVGYFLHPVGVWLIQLTGGNEVEFQHWYGRLGLLLLALPIPYKITAIASGLFKFDLVTFVIASIVIRGLRFFIVAGLVRAYGERMRDFVERRLALALSAVAVAAVAVLLGVRYWLQH